MKRELVLGGSAPGTLHWAWLRGGGVGSRPWLPQDLTSQVLDAEASDGEMAGLLMNQTSLRMFLLEVHIHLTAHNLTKTLDSL